VFFSTEEQPCSKAAIGGKFQYEEKQSVQIRTIMRKAFSGEVILTRKVILSLVHRLSGQTLLTLRAQVLFRENSADLTATNPAYCTAFPAS